ncbi:LuxR C-terminal-related transcriptional regulator [uncultured Enterococcus sp.]|uniref:response regulator transcription factor n=1 Tax=uncultured Enterococcus sp. TaxID=167972 RepID=UPI002AA830CD|nr:LuxR C-terminal-related transcriptional regulator [uncultured Enterococcus sp.]
MVAVFLYNILLIVLYALAMALSINFFLRRKQTLFLLVTIYLLFFIFDNAIIYMTEFINSFASSYNETFMSIPVAKTIIYVVNAYCSLLIINNLLKRKTSFLQYSFVVLLTIWMSLVPLMANSATKVWLYYLPNQLFLMYLGLYGWHHLKKTTDFSPARYFYTKWISLSSMIFGLLILLEDSYVIYRVDQYTFLNVKINNRNICEDIFSMLVCFLLLHYFFKTEEQVIEEVVEEKEDVQFQQFCRHYGFTQREQEICILLLEHKSNQQIADEIFLSLGTVKTHIHNIFIKLNVKKRNQVIEAYEAFNKSGKIGTEISSTAV